MKKTIILAIALAVSVSAVVAQGTVNFANVGGTLNAPVFFSDGTTRVPTGYTAQLLTGPSSGSLSAITTTPFVGNGYFTGPGVAINVAAGQTAFVQILAYLTSYGSYAAAQTAGIGGIGNVYGQSSIFTVVPANPNANPPDTPAALANLQSFNLNPVPEPTTFALLGLGAASLLVFRRRK